MGKYNIEVIFNDQMRSQAFIERDGISIIQFVFLPPYPFLSDIWLKKKKEEMNPLSYFNRLTQEATYWASRNTLFSAEALYFVPNSATFGPTSVR